MEFQKRGYSLLEATYTNNKRPMRYRCPNHPEKQLLMNLNNLLSGYGCPYCAYDSNTGENNHKWKGGVSELNQFLRSKIWEWKTEAINSSSGVCWVSGSSIDLQVHHPYPYHKIRDEALVNVGLPTRETIGEYDAVELARLVDEFRRLHSRHRGVLLNASVHSLFHALYGFDTDTSDLFKFKQRYLRGEFKADVRAG